MKKIITLFAAIALGTAMIGCAPKDEASTTTTESTPAGTTKTETKTTTETAGATAGAPAPAPATK